MCGTIKIKGGVNFAQKCLRLKDILGRNFEIFAGFTFATCLCQGHQ